MARPLALLLTSLGALVLVLVVVVLLAHATGPGTASSATVEGLGAEVVVGFTTGEVPIIEAASEADLFAGMGYAHAMRNAWPMTLLHLTATGGRSQHTDAVAALQIDEHVLRLGFRQTARATYDALPDSVQAVFAAYASGVNASFRANRLDRGDHFVQRGVVPDAWQPWDPIAVEQLVAYLATRPTVAEAGIGAGGPIPEHVREFLEADSLLRTVLGTGGFEHSMAVAARDTAGTSLMQRIVFGRTALPVVEEMELRLPGRRVVAATVPGTLALLGGWSDSDGWAVVPTGMANIRFTTMAPPEPVFDRVVRDDGREMLVRSRRATGILFLGDEEPVAPPPSPVDIPDEVDAEPEPEPEPEPLPDPAPPAPTPPPAPREQPPPPQPAPPIEEQIPPEPEPEAEEGEVPEPVPPPAPDPSPPAEVEPPPAAVPEPAPPPPPADDPIEPEPVPRILNATLVTYVTRLQDPEEGDEPEEIVLPTAGWWVLEWPGLDYGTDIAAWRALLAGEQPSFRLFRGGAIHMRDGDAPRVIGSPAFTRSVPGGVLIGSNDLHDQVARRLAVADSLFPAPSEFGADTYSAWAASLAPSLIQAVGPADSLQGGVRDAYQYLQGWNFHYDPAAIGASVFDRWMYAYRDLTGELPSPLAMELEPVERVDTLQIPFGRYVAEVVARAREEGERPPAIADTLTERPALADSLVTVIRMRLEDTRDLTLLKQALRRAVEELNETHGGAGAGWRWARVQDARLRFTGRADRPGERPAGRRYRDVLLGDGGHPTTLRWGPSPIFYDAAYPAGWTGWRSSAEPRSVFVRSQPPFHVPPHLRYDETPGPVPTREISPDAAPRRTITLRPPA